MGIHMSGQKVKIPNLFRTGMIEICKCHNVVLAVVSGSSSGVQPYQGSADYSAENTAKSTPDDQETTLGIGRSIARFARMVNGIYGKLCVTRLHLLEVTANILQNHLARNFFFPDHQKESTICLRIFPQTHIVRFARYERYKTKFKKIKHRATKFGEIITADHSRQRRRIAEQ